jgi:hypothetical protein
MWNSRPLLRVGEVSVRNEVWLHGIVLCLVVLFLCATTGFMASCCASLCSSSAPPLAMTDEHLKYCLRLCLSNYEPSFASYRLMCSVMHQLRNGKFNEKHLLIMVNYLF